MPFELTLNIFNLRYKPALNIPDILPAEILLHIFSYLSLQALLSASAVSKNWQKISSDNTLWKPLFEQHFPGWEKINFEYLTFWNRGLYIFTSSPIANYKLKFIEICKEHFAKQDLAFYFAVLRGDCKTVAELITPSLDQQALANKVSKLGFSLLHYAALNNRADIIELLYKSGIEINLAESKQKLTSLHMAVLKGHTESARSLILNGADPLLKDNPGNKAFDYAILNDSFDLFSLLVKEYREKVFQTRYQEGNLPQNQWLIDDSPFFKNAFYLAAQDSNLELLKKIFYSTIASTYYPEEFHNSLPNDYFRSRIDRRDLNTALFWSAACSYSHAKSLETIIWLIEKGATIHAINQGYGNILHFILRKEILRYALEQGVNINLKNKDRITPLQKVVFGGWPYQGKLLLAYGANLYHCSCQNSCTEENCNHRVKNIAAKNKKYISDSYIRQGTAAFYLRQYLKSPKLASLFDLKELAKDLTLEDLPEVFEVLAKENNKEGEPAYSVQQLVDLQRRLYHLYYQHQRLNWHWRLVITILAAIVLTPFSLFYTLPWLRNTLHERTSLDTEFDETFITKIKQQVKDKPLANQTLKPFLKKRHQLRKVKILPNFSSVLMTSKQAKKYDVLRAAAKQAAANKGDLPPKDAAYYRQCYTAAKA